VQEYKQRMIGTLSIWVYTISKKWNNSSAIISYQGGCKTNRVCTHKQTNEDHFQIFEWNPACMSLKQTSMHDIEAKLQIQVALALSCKYLTETKILGEKLVLWILTNLKLHMNCSSWMVTVIKWARHHTSINDSGKYELLPRLSLFDWVNAICNLNRLIKGCVRTSD
jgi:hypothetical protein